MNVIGGTVSDQNTGHRVKERGERRMCEEINHNVIDILKKFEKVIIRGRDREN